MRRLLISLLVATSMFTAVSALLPSVANAAPRENCAAESKTFLGLPTWYKYLEPNGSSGDCKLTLPKDSDGNESVILAASRILLAVFEIILRIAGLAAVGFIIFGGFQYLISQGEPDRTKGAKSTILNAVIGLAITLSATAIVSIIGNNIT